VPKSASPLCGNTISQDRRFLVKFMPKLEAYFHYRNLDVSTLKELSRRWKPEVLNAFKKAQKEIQSRDSFCGCLGPHPVCRCARRNFDECYSAMISAGEK
jgi:hypothetical protein